MRAARNANSFIATSRAYGDWSRTETWPYRQRLLSRAVDTIQMFTTSGKVKNAADIRLAIDVIEDLYLLHDITDVVIVAAMLCRAYGFDWEDLESAVHAKMARNAQRTWAAHNGTARHVDVEPS